MKSINLIIKNIKLLIRSKSSALVVLLAPLLIVLIIGIGFADFEDSRLNIGVHVSEPSELTDRFIANLNSSDNNIIFTESQEICTRQIQEGSILACVSFPEGFALGDERQELTFLVDESRINLVYRLISSLTASVGSEQAEISQEITAQLLTVIDQSAEGFSSTISNIVSLKSRAASISSGVLSASEGISNLNVSTTSFNHGSVRSEIVSSQGDYNSLNNRALSVISAGEEFYNQTASSPSPQRDSFKEALDDLEDAVSQSSELSEEFDLILERFDDFVSAFNSLRSQLSEARSVQSSVQSSLGNVQSAISNLDGELDNIKVNQERLLDNINRLEFRTAETIAQPFSTNIKTITSDLGRLTYSFPYLLMLVIMFVGIMLSSTLVFMEKDSKAFFRNFTTPIRQFFFTSMTFFTSLLIILIQVGVILLVAYLFLDIAILSNWQSNLVVILLASTMFILLGMIIGNIFSTSEAITMSNIAIGSILMFLSNLILPLETLSEGIQKVASYNPFVIGGEAIRGTLLFNFDLISLIPNIILMVSISIILFAFLIIFQNVSSSNYIHKLKTRNVKIILPEDNYLKIELKDKDNLVIKDIEDLLNSLENLSDSEYSEIIKTKNVFSDWLKKNLKERFLAFKIKNKSRLKAINTLRKKLKKK